VSKGNPGRYLGKFIDPRKVPKGRDNRYYQDLGWDKADDGHPRSECDPSTRLLRIEAWKKRRKA
jgi:hypothetical protein